MGRWLTVLVLFLALQAGPAFAATKPPPSPAPPPRSMFNDWAAIVVAGDWRAHSGGPTEAFDNARRDVAAALVGMGFRPGNVTQFSTRPERYNAARPLRTHPLAMYETLKATAERAPGGCLFYYTSHGAPSGPAMDVDGEIQVVPPSMMAAIVDQACPGRPTIVVISTCFSGVNVPFLESPQRLVLTAARRDRTSFGCSEEDKYPFFDDCFLQSTGAAGSLATLPPAIQGCVSRKEREMNLESASEPQVWVGSALRPMLPLMAFPRAPPRLGTQ